MERRRHNDVQVHLLPARPRRALAVELCSCLPGGVFALMCGALAQDMMRCHRPTCLHGKPRKQRHVGRKCSKGMSRSASPQCAHARPSRVSLVASSTHIRSSAASIASASRCASRGSRSCLSSRLGRAVLPGTLYLGLHAVCVALLGPSALQDSDSSTALAHVPSEAQEARWCKLAHEAEERERLPDSQPACVPCVDTVSSWSHRRRVCTQALGESPGVVDMKAE